MAKLTAAQLDSNGKTVKLDRFDSAPQKQSEFAVGEYYKERFSTRKNRCIITKVSTAKVWYDLVDADNAPVKGHSGDWGYSKGKVAFGKDWKKY